MAAAGHRKADPAHPAVGRLLSVNVGQPRDVEWQGKTIRTAVWKDPVDGPRMVRKVNVDGDDQADREAHGGEHRAVFVYQIEPRIATGSASSIETTSSTDSSARTSPSMA